jgi:AcrR family transcriptional regulator
MRKVAPLLGVVPMALYKHVSSKNELLGAMVDVVFGEFHDPVIGGDWQREMRTRAVTARDALNRHPWAVGLMESRPDPGPASARHHNATIGCLREAGFSFEMAVHAYSVQDAYIYGFALQEQTMPFETPEESGEVVTRQAKTLEGFQDFPYLVEVATKLPEAGYDAAMEFDWGLDLILEGLVKRLSEER